MEWQGRCLLYFCRSGLTCLEAEAADSVFQDVVTADQAVQQSVFIFASPKTVAHSLKVRFVVMMTLVPCVAFDDAVTSMRGLVYEHLDTAGTAELLHSQLRSVCQVGRPAIPT